MGPAHFGNLDQDWNLNHCPCIGNPGSTVRYVTGVVFSNWSIYKGRPLLIKYDKLFQKLHFVNFAIDKNHKWGWGPFDQLWHWQEEMVPVDKHHLDCHLHCFCHLCPLYLPATMWQLSTWGLTAVILSQPPKTSTIAKQLFINKVFSFVWPWGEDYAAPVLAIYPIPSHREWVVNFFSLKMHLWLTRIDQLHCISPFQF